MAYFLKQTKQGDRIYLQISETTYNNVTKKSSNRVYQKLGYLDALISEEMPDPIAFYKAKIVKMNKKLEQQKAEESILKIAEDPTRNIGYFLVKALVNTLKLSDEMELMNRVHDYNFNMAAFVEALTYSRIVEPCSKLKTYTDIFPYLYEKYDLSLDQIYSGLDFVGSRYSQFIEILNYRINKTFSRDTKYTYFDCTNYYFEIDLEKDDKQKGPSKENRHDPIIGQALLLDGEGIPLGMKMYAGNKSEKPMLKKLIDEIKRTHNLSGKTVHVADKGLNSGENIHQTLKDGNGYIYSQSVMQLDEKERKWVLSPYDYEDVKDNSGNLLYRIKACVDNFPIWINTEDGKKERVLLKQKRVVTFNPSLAEKERIEINKQIDKAINLSHSQAKKEEYGDSSKYVKFVDSDGNKADIIINEDKIKKDLELAGYNLLVTSELKMSKREVYRVYHNLWKIEDTFRVLKSELDARPVYLQNKERIYGHFLICYYGVTLLRLLETKIFKDTFNIYDIINLIRNLKILKGKDKNTNLSKATKNINTLTQKYDFNIDNFYLTDNDVDKLFKYKYRLKK